MITSLESASNAEPLCLCMGVVLQTLIDVGFEYFKAHPMRDDITGELVKVRCLMMDEFHHPLLAACTCGMALYWGTCRLQQLDILNAGMSSRRT